MSPWDSTRAPAKKHQSGPRGCKNFGRQKQQGSVTNIATHFGEAFDAMVSKDTIEDYR